MSASELIEIIKIGGSTLDKTTNVLTIQGKGPGTDDSEPDNGSEGYADIAVFGTLGITARPAAATDAGGAEGILVRKRADGLVIGARDTRTADVYGQLDPGDVAIHSTGDKHAPRIFLKEASSTLALMTKDSQGKDMVVSLDGTNDKFIFSGFKMVLQASRADGWSFGLEYEGGSSLFTMTPDGTVAIAAKKIILNGTVYLGANAATATPVTACIMGTAGMSGIACTSVFCSAG